MGTRPHPYRALEIALVTGRRKKGKSRWFFVLVGLVIVALAGFFALPWLLIAQAELTHADVILHLHMDAHADADAYVAQLYKQGHAREIVCVSAQAACDVYPADDAARHLIALGVPREDVSTLYLPIRDCDAEYVRQMVEYAQAQGWHSALLVVNPIGSRSRRRLVRRYFGQVGMRAAVTYSPRDRQAFVHQWWRTHAPAQRMIAAAMHSVLDWLYPQCR